LIFKLISKDEFSLVLYRQRGIDLLGGTFEDVFNKVEKRFDINLSAIRSMSSYNLFHHHIVIRHC